jgi:hypothetical protein
MPRENNQLVFFERYNTISDTQVGLDAFVTNPFWVQAVGFFHGLPGAFTWYHGNMRSSAYSN